MTEPHSDTLRNTLLAQEPSIPEARYQEYRMRLEQAYQTAFRRERRALWACLGLLGSSLGVMVLLAVIAERRKMAIEGWPLAIPGELLAAAMVAACVWYRSKLRLERCDADRTSGQIAEINQKLDDLTRRFNDHFKNKADQSAQSQ
jgi:hypothetical protein